MPGQVSPTTQNLAASSTKPASPKKEFLKLLREIEQLFGTSRAEAANYIFDLIAQTQGLGDKQQYWTRRQAVAVGLGYLAGGALGLRNNSQTLVTVGGKTGEAAQLLFQAQTTDIQAENQRIQQELTHWTTFEQNIKTIMDTVRNYILQEQQKELENAQMNR